MATNGFKKSDDVFGTIDLDDQYVTDQYLVDKYVGGQLWAWGLNAQGELGNGNTAYYSSPVQVGSLVGWKEVSSGYESVLATKNDGTLWAWGNNSVGQLGQNNTTNFSSPIQVGSLTNWKQVSINGNFSCSVGAIKLDGTLWMWGYNFYGTLGQNNTTTVSSPVQVGT